MSNSAGNEFFSWSLTRDVDGKISGKSETVDGVTTQYAYDYDENGRLLTVHKDGTLVEEYRYDANGNRTYTTNEYLGISGMIATHSIEDHLMTAGDTVFEYDLDDNLARKTKGSEITDYNYSSTGELLSVILPDNTTIEYVNDPLGRRIAKKINGVIVEKYLWQNLTTLLAVYDGDDNLLIRFEYSDGRMPYAMSYQGANYYLGYDQVGSLSVVTDTSGLVVKRIDYDSFGNIIDETNQQMTIPLGFAGGLHDRDTGLVRFGFRDYCPEIGRWTAKDPILFAGGDPNLYGYVLGGSG